MESNGRAGKHGLEGDVDLQILLLGGKLMKVKSSSWKKVRMYKLHDDYVTVWHESHRIFKRKQNFSIDDVDSVRKGRQSEGLKKHTEAHVEDLCFSIIFKGRRRTLDLVATSVEEARQWVNGLEKILSNMKKLNRQQTSEHWIFNCMRKADKNNDNMMTLKELKHFLRQINIEVDDTYAKLLFTVSGYLLVRAAWVLINKLDDSAKHMNHMTKDGFLMYMQQEEGSIFNPAHKKVFQDMSQPINHYFISSSHNTYLMEDQLKGPSSTEAYIKALMKSCRCVELDCWDGAQGEPVIYHGHTLTSKVLFKDVIKAIKEYAFKVTMTPDPNPSWSTPSRFVPRYKPVSALHGHFLRPHELKGRFIIKGKRLNKLDAVFSSTSPGLEEDCVSEEDEAAETSNSKTDSNTDSNGQKAKAKTAAKAFIQHNMTKLSRIYPAGSRTASSNYNPVPLWNAGCQIVALNFQTPSKEMDLNQGRFRSNGLSGYVLKPEFQRDPGSEFNPMTLTKGPWIKRQAFHIMSLQVLTPCGMMFLSAGFNPMWNETFQFDIQVPELAMLRFLVEDYDATSQNDLIGHYCLPLTSLQNGYRHVPLLTKRGDVIPSAGLFVHLMLLDAK
ncbi:1-phosphatidylinositol 4,5-bisphosphate phosphodiesterase delta-1 [Salvelinus sp. IW2-2015]|uniref:1-phosphatidylinositol 4,5-bisphosphate phosphodiesterase delta-1 n=1 Tax=Salvelinus sp. IW2-2015 TaxID=2691554 RepID=UPI0038D4335F